MTHEKLLKVALTRKTFVDEQEAAGWLNSLHVLPLIWRSNSSGAQEEKNSRWLLETQCPATFCMNEFRESSTKPFRALIRSPRLLSTTQPRSTSEKPVQNRSPEPTLRGESVLHLVLKNLLNWWRCWSKKEAKVARFWGRTHLEVRTDRVRRVSVPSGGVGLAHRTRSRTEPNCQSYSIRGGPVTWPHPRQDSRGEARERARGGVARAAAHLEGWKDQGRN